MDFSKAIDILKKSGVMLEGHFLLTSGRHSNRYMQCARLFEYPEFSCIIAEDIADAFEEDDIDLVVGPAMGGVILAYEVASQLGVRNLFAERQDGRLELRRGFFIEPGSNVLVVEDVVTTGGSVMEVIDIVKQAGANVAGVGFVVDRSGGKVDFGCRKHAVVAMEVESWDAADCPLCKQGSTAVKPGSRGLK